MIRTCATAAVAAVLAALAAGVGPATGTAAACRVPAHQIGWEAIFGYRTTYGGATTLRSRAQRVGFQHLVIEQVGCPRWAVALHGIRDERQGREFRAEAARAHFDVVLRCWPLSDTDPYWEAIFGERLGKRAAVRLRSAATHKGFVGLKLLHDPCSNTWLVELDNIKSLRQARAFRAEARRAGFDVVLERRY